MRRRRTRAELSVDPAAEWRQGRVNSKDVTYEEWNVKGPADEA